MSGRFWALVNHNLGTMLAPGSPTLNEHLNVVGQVAERAEVAGDLAHLGQRGDCIGLSERGLVTGRGARYMGSESTGLTARTLWTGPVLAR